jgi:hypothetical protein
MTPEEKFQERITWHDDDIVFLGKPTVTETVVPLDDDGNPIEDADEPTVTYKTPRRR